MECGGAGEMIINRRATVSDLPLAGLAEARSRTLALAADLTDEQLTVPLLEIINPILWELGHIAYFAEFWILRHLLDHVPIIASADAFYDSAKVSHNLRWSLPLPSRAQTLAFMWQTFDEIAAADVDLAGSEEASYFYRLTLYHEDMHAEALAYTRQTLGYAAPAYATRSVPFGGALPGDVRIPGGRYSIGGLPEDGFVFDNEKWAHGIELAPFEIARAPVTNAEFADFIASGGYRKASFWSHDGWAWRENSRAEHPLYWQPGAKTRRSFDREIALRNHEPICNVNYYEAQAFCAWAGRRLPTEAEWEVAATGGQRRRYPWGDELPTENIANADGVYGGVCEVGAFEAGESPTGCRQMIGNVWEWTSSAFQAYPGFRADPYKEYSEPWFGTHYVLRGGAWTTRTRLVSTRWRNFYRPQRRDVMTGFRTVKT